MKKIIALLLALAMLFALAACGNKENDEGGNDTPTSPTQNTENQTPEDDNKEPDDGNETVELDWDNPIPIGHIADLTGVEASTGLLASDAMKLAVAYFNEQGGVNGRPLEIVEVDAQSDSAVAKDAAQTMVEANNVAAILGPTQIGHKLSVAGYVAEAHVPAVFYNGTPPVALENNDYVIGLGGTTTQMPSVMADYIFNVLGYRTIVTITQDNTGGDNYVNPLIEKFTDLGGKVLDSLRVPSAESDTTQYMAQAARAGADGIVAWLSGSQAINLWTQWYEQGVYETTPMVGAVHGGFTDYFIWNALNGANPAVVDAALESGVYAPITYAYSVDNEINDALVEYYAEHAGEYEKLGGDVPVGSNMVGAVFAAVQATVEAMKTLDDPTDSEALYQALQEVSLTTPEGHLSLTEGSRAAVKDIHIVKVVKLDDGTFNYEVVKTYTDVPGGGLE